MEEEQRQGFEINSPYRANWAICRIKEERRQRDIYIETARECIAEYESKIQEAQRRCEEDTAWLMQGLAAYMDELPCRETKTQRTAVLPDGKLRRKLAKQDFDHDDAVLTAYLRDSAPEYLKTEQKPVWGEFKKQLTVKDGLVLRADTGEIVDGVTVREVPESFDIE